MVRSAVLILALLTAPAAADPADRVAASIASRSDRLILFSLSKYLQATRDPAVLPLLQNMMRLQGLGLTQETTPRGLVARSIALAPVLTYDGNINGGNVNDSFTLGPGLEFRGDPDFAAVGGIVAGGYVAPRVRYVVDEGRYLDARVALYGVHSPEYDLTKTSVGGELCVGNHLTGWRFADFCLSGRQLNVELGRSRELSASAGLTTLFRTAYADNELTVTARQTWFDDYDQPSVGVDLTSAVPGFGALRLGVDLGPPVTDVLALENAVTLGASTPVAGKLVDFDVTRAQYGGGIFFGETRDEVTWTATLGFDVIDGFGTEIRYTRNRSTIDFYDYDSFGFGLVFRGLEIG